MAASGKKPGDEIDAARLLGDFLSTGDISQLAQVAARWRQSLIAAGGDIDTHAWPIQFPKIFEDRALFAIEALGKFLREGEPTDLDIAIGAWRSVADDARFPKAPERFRAAAVNDLATNYLRRFETRSDIRDLDAAIEAGREAIRLLPSGVADAYTYYVNLARMLRERYRLGHDQGDADEAIAVLRNGMECAPSQATRSLRIMVAQCLALRARGGKAIPELQRAAEALECELAEGGLAADLQEDLEDELGRTRGWQAALGASDAGPPHGP